MYELSDGDRKSLISGVTYPENRNEDEESGPNPDFPNFMQWQKKNKILRSQSVSSIESSEYTRDGSRANSFDFVRAIVTRNRQNDPGVVNFSEVAGVVGTEILIEQSRQNDHLGGLENYIMGNIMTKAQ